MDIDKILGHPLADKSAVGAINRPLRSDWGISLMCIIAPMASSPPTCIDNTFFEDMRGIQVADGNSSSVGSIIWSRN
jgi:hypothetical protein